ncbi:bifunctional [glutamate--ammonia ligase]-adenylyl-L-tyrosine phosphorylase/[glutamate--ammonia-ligase] adenylyltransferase [Bowmanella yangjiangensis]|uniref:Bifunctional glutamine synthetase adenylyltransferase/adenylyl-removing enzyme n=1 Tax=Bowmanella yangjiangensis TaxID=2811230 RepID=A0ABS3CTA7_9ALTE|nr:bifunctional [glutamate--ammonia ligase]-adenylyl-L-tyrosine phosphorylase/[glutamate--ammonia-ligase] adenylyltransferase [Bowmanella yangjiangensis]MBN7820354.1 bifunctional [glutamate--ammonia ligase]-adenylyl-L-tyrosine phosphorylase/[glutamate--ammonia-ligase] adenylyltransferase [Bowmanella yangjiangensis]
MRMTDLSPSLLSIGHKHWQRLLELHPQAEWLAAMEECAVPVFSMSDFVARSCLQDVEILRYLLLDGGISPQMPDYAGLLEEALSTVTDENQMHRVLRFFRRRHMVRLAWLDFTHGQSIDDSLVQVSKLANALIEQACHWCYQQLAERYGTPMSDGVAQPLLVLGMGKLGGEELNFSSDIDLIFCYPELGETEGGRRTLENQQFFVKVGQKLITALNQVTADGQVFRVDMRLRPFGESGPLVMHFSAFEDYYQEQGREWERYAMVKARIINPVAPFADELKGILRPFVFRRYMDFSAIEALRNMKRLISQEVRRRQLTDNIKLGGGGIREVEFIVQAFQLIRGGREAALQHPGLFAVLNELKARAWLSVEDADALGQSYRFLRKAEHHLQQFNDEQTQTLPADDIGRQRLHIAMGYDDYAAFYQALEMHMQTIHGQFMELIGDESEQEPSEEVNELSDLWCLPLTDEEALGLLAKFLDEQRAGEFWHTLSGFAQEMRNRAMGTRGRESLDKLMPLVLCACLKDNPSPSMVLARLFGVLKAVCRRTAYLDLLLENPGALAQLVRLCSASPWIAEQIGRFPILLDELLNPQHLYQLAPLDGYYSELRQFLLRIPEQDLEARMEAMRQFKLSQQLKIAAADVTGVLPLMKVSDHLTFLAEALIKQVVLDAWQQMTERYGQPDGVVAPQLGFGVIAYGKLGGIELGYGSDLDLVFVHDCDSQQDTVGGKPIESRQFYIKLAQRIMHLFNTKTASGQLYETDLRLRPAGNSGLLVCHINGFAEYQLQEAWTWEHQALCRSRFVFGDEMLAARFQRIRKQVICQPRDKPKLADDVRQMREKMREHLQAGQGFDLKQGSGGIADIEFLTQYWVLSESHQHNALCFWSDNVRILESLQAHGVISEQWARSLTEAYLAYRDAGHRYVLDGQPAVDESGRFDELREQVRLIWQQTLG